MRRRHALTLSLALLAAVAGCNSGGGKTSDRSRAAAAINSSTTGLLVSSVPVGPAALMTDDVPVLALSFGASGVSAQLQAITLRASGTVDEPAALGEVRLVGDDDGDGRVSPGEPVLATVAAPAFAANDGSVTLTLANPITLAPGASVRLLVVVDATATGAAAMARIGQTVTLTVDDAAAIQSSPAASGPFPISGTVALGVNDHLLISELCGPLAEEEQFIELFNPTGLPIDLSDVYFTDADDLDPSKSVEYYLMPTGASYGPSNTVADFMVRFPAGATIAPGACVTIALEGAGFLATYGKPADYCVRDPAGGSVQMLTSAGNGVWTADPDPDGFLFPSGEPITLFTWDGTSDLVKDLDYVYWGTKSQSGPNDPHDKTAVAVDGPDPDTTPSVYLPDTPASQQATAQGDIIQRVDFTEGAERKSGGNGLTGHDETSEDVDVTFITATTPTPGTP